MLKTKNTIRRSHRNSKSRRRRVFYLVGWLAAVLIAAGGIFAAFSYLNNRGPQNDQDPESIVASPDFSEGTEREVGEPVERNGNVSDTSGQNGQNQQHTPITSASGNISVYLPRANQLLKPGDTISGTTANADRIWYRLIDDQVGNLVEGSLSVVDGRFSGVFDFNTSGNAGRLDVFTVTEDGTEADNIEIDIRFR